MTPKEYLSQYRDKVLEIKVMEESIRELEDRATSVTASTDGDRVQGSGNKDKIGTIASKIADMQGECRMKANLALNTRTEIEETINKVTNQRYKAILHLRYIEMKKWTEIRDIIFVEGEDLRWLYRMHGKALQEIKEYIEI